MAIRRWDSKESWNLSMSLGRARGKELTWWIKILTNCPVEWLRREKKNPETLPLKICIILMCMKEWNKKVFFLWRSAWCKISWAVAAPFIHSQAGKWSGCGMMGTLAGRSHGDIVACRAVQTGRGALPQAVCLGVATGWRFKITPKLRRNTPEYLHGCSQSK